MASQFTQLSPGVDFREIDLTGVVGTAGASTGAFAGNFHWGPALELTTLSDQLELEAQFHKPADDNFVDWYAVADFLAYTGNIQVVRVVDEDSALNSTDDGAGILIKNREHFEVVQTITTTIKVAARYPGALGDSLSVSFADADSFEGWEYADEFDTAPGTSALAASLGAKNDELHAVVIDTQGQFSGVPGSVLERFAYLSKATDSKDANNAPNYLVNQLNRSSRFIHVLNPPNGADLTDPNTGALDTFTVSNGGSGYTSAPTVVLTGGGGTGATATAVLGVNVGVDDDQVVSITLDTPGTGYTSAPTVSFTGGDGTGAVATVSLETEAGTAWGTTMVVSGSPVTFKSLDGSFDVDLTGGDNGTIGADEYIEGYSLFSNKEQVDVSLVIMGYSGGPSNHTAVTQWVIDNIGEQRRDVVVFFSPKLDDVLNKTQSMAVTNATATRNTVARGSSYAVMDSGWKLRYDVYNDKYRWVPLNSDIAGLCAYVDNNFDPWISPGGYNRGKIRNAVSLAFNPNKTSRDNLYKIGINPVVTFPVDGTILYGDKTLQGKNSAFSQIGIRRLFILLQKTTTAAAKYFLFELNNPFTRANFVNLVQPYLEEVKGRGGIADYKVVCDESNNTAEVIMNRQFVGQFFIKPVYAINWIRLDFIAVRQDVDFNEIVGQAF